MINGLVWQIRRVIYRFGGRPKPGSIWFSPSLSHIYAFKKGIKIDSN